MSLKKKILVVALAMGSIFGYGVGFAHMYKHGTCHRSAWQERVSSPCERGRNAWHERYERSRDHTPDQGAIPVSE